jgi:hypothetical protein
MTRELAWIAAHVTILTITGIVIVSCASSRPPDGRAERNPFNAPVAIPKPPVRPPNAPPMPLASISAILPSNHPPAKIGLSWEPVAGAAGYLLYVSRGNQNWSYRVDVGSNTTVNLTNYSAPMEFQVTAYNSGRLEGPASDEAYYGARSNGWVIGTAFVFIAQPGSTYTLSNAPLTSNRWTFWQTISNRSGLVTVPLTNHQGRVSWMAAR